MQTTAYRLPESLRDDLERFRQEVEKLQRGETTAAAFRAFRVPRGVYEQRESDTYMLRVRFPAGVILPHQMRALAQFARRYGNHVLHVTTRQDVQVHRVLLADIPPALADLYEAGLSTQGGGGNTVRNITGCPNAGVCASEVFDASPYALAVTEFLLPDPLSYQLPRKYKLAFSGCAKDCAAATVNDLGFVARTRGGVRGFAVYVGGGMGASSRVGDLLEEFVPADEAHWVAEAVKRVFDQHGNRRNRHRARLRFLVEEIGLAEFRRRYEAQLAPLQSAGPARLAPRPLPGVHSAAAPHGLAPSPGAADPEWRQQCVARQKQEGFYLVSVPLPLGDIDADALEKLAEVVQNHGERTLRSTQRQNFVLRWVHQSELDEVYAKLRALNLAGDRSPVAADLVACTGAATCRLGICLSRGLAKAIRGTLAAAPAELKSVGDLKINISGCPNSCGRHPVADIGLFGAARRLGGRLAPHYVLQLGGQLGEGRTKLASGNQAIPARNVPALLAELIGRFRKSSQCPDFATFLEAQRGEVAELLAAHRNPANENDGTYCIDWDAAEPFSLAGRGPGECGAGVFDLIELDLGNSRDAVRSGRLLEAVVFAARALLVTRGQQAGDDGEALRLFARHFLDESLVDSSFKALVALTARAVGSEPVAAFPVPNQEVARFVSAIEDLYKGMDASLRFKPAGETPAATGAAVPAAPEIAAAKPPGQSWALPEREADFRGVVCPLNYVKTKMLLDGMARGSVLSVLLDEAGARNVPASVEKDGHHVLTVQQEPEHWRVLIRKA